MTDEATTPSTRKGITSYGPANGVPRFLSDVIIELGLADVAAVDQAVEAARGGGETVAAVLVRMGVLTEDQLARAIAARYGLDHVNLNEFEVDPSAANLLPPAAAQRYHALPICFEPDGSLLVAFADPSDALALSDIAFMTKLDVLPAVASADLISVWVQKLPMRIPPGAEQGSPFAGEPAPTVPPPETSTFSSPPAAPAEHQPGPPSSHPDPRIETLEAQLTEGAAAIEAQRTEHEAELEALRGERDALSRELEGLRPELDGLRHERDGLRDERNAATDQLEQLRNEREHAEAAQPARHDLEAELAQLRGQLEALQSEAAAAHAQASARDEELQAAKAEASTRAGELEAARAEAGTLAEALEATKADAAARAEELERARAELVDRHERLEAAEADASALREELDAARSEARRRAEELAGAEAAASSAAERVETAERRAQEAEARAEGLAGTERLANEAREMLGKLRHEFELEREAYAANERDLGNKLAAAVEETERVHRAAERVAAQIAGAADELNAALGGDPADAEAPIYVPEHYVD